MTDMDASVPISPEMEDKPEEQSETPQEVKSSEENQEDSNVAPIGKGFSSNVTHRIFVDYTQEELLDFGETAGEAFKQKAKLEFAFEAIKKTHKGNIESVAKDLSEVLEALRDKGYYENVSCIMEADHKNEEMVFISRDTDKEIDRRPMTEEQKQQLELNAKEEDPQMELGDDQEDQPKE